MRERERVCMCVCDLRSGADVANIGGNTRGASDIVEGELTDKKVELHKQSQRLADPTDSAQNVTMTLRLGTESDEYAQAHT